MPSTPVVGYLRVSTDEQVKGSGLEVQEKAIRSHARANGMRLVGVFSDEGESGSNGLEHRSGLAEALAAIEDRKASALVVYRLDRLARDLILQEGLIGRLRETGARVVSATEPDIDGGEAEPTRDMVRQILGVIAQYERAVIRGRMLAGKAAKVAKGGYGGGRPPYGKQSVKGELVDDPDQKEIVDLVVKLRRKGGSYREIGAELTKRGFVPKAGGSWQPNTIRRIVMRADPEATTAH